MNSPTPSPVTIAPKQCPFCGEAATLERDLPSILGGQLIVYARCTNAGCAMAFDGHAMPIDQWNRRPRAGDDMKASSVVPVEKLEELEANLRGKAGPPTSYPDIHISRSTYLYCADRIAQLIKEAKGE